MQHPHRHAVRVATILRRQLERLRVADIGRTTERRAALTTRMVQLTELAQRMNRAWRCQYHGASRRLQRRFDRQLADLVSEINFLRSNPEHDGDPGRPLPTPRQVLDELRQIEDEFGGWMLENGSRTLSVETDPITLEYLHLGRFRLALDLHRLGDSPHVFPLRVEALEPNPAAGSDRVTHPHVRDECLCTGDATAPLGHALRDGRLADVFMLVRNVLNTYNPDSPYVSIDDWEAEGCPECGGSMYEDTRCWCELCDRDYCDECVGTCQHCSETTCYGCLRTCDHCEETFCRQCMTSCGDCGEACCPGCLDDDLCPNCHETKENDDENQEDPIQEPLQQEAPAHPPTVQASQPTAA
ncbi:MAG: hypothetical protein AAGH88_08905 [Planctomycetota bacterium]